MADIDIRQLQYFVAAAESGSFVRAAKLANVSQPAITKSIQRMEQWFGHTLFERGAELKLTAFGEAIIAEAKRVLSDFDGLKDTASQFGKNWVASVRIGVGPLMAETLVGEAVGRLLDRHPGFRVEIQVDRYNVFPDMLRNGHLDFFVADVSELKEARDLEIRELAPSPLQWFCRKGHPLARRKQVALQDILAYPVVFPPLPIWAQEWFARQMPPDSTGGMASPPFRQSVVCSHYSTLKRIVLKSDAVSALTELVLHRKSYARLFAVIDFRGTTPSSNPGIVTVRKRNISPAAHLLAEEMFAVSEHPEVLDFGGAK